ncbi:MAG TPA: GNAT family N-acetyltransferase [Dokdonella sp.]
MVSKSSEVASVPAPRHDDGRAAAPSPSDFPARPFLSTRRLRLRELCLADIPSLTAMNADADVARSLVEPCPTDYVGVARIVFHANACYLTRPGLGVWHASDPDGRFVGVFSLMPIEGSEDVEIGTRLSPWTWGRLYPIEGGRALCAHAFDTVGLPRVLGLCHPDNIAVPAILRRLGFTAEGETLHFGHRALRFVLQREDWRPLQDARRAERSTDPSTEGAT